MQRPLARCAAIFDRRTVGRVLVGHVARDGDVDTAIARVGGGRFGPRGAPRSAGGLRRVLLGTAAAISAVAVSTARAFIALLRGSFIIEIFWTFADAHG